MFFCYTLYNYVMKYTIQHIIQHLENIYINIYIQVCICENNNNYIDFIFNKKIKFVMEKSNLVINYTITLLNFIG